MRRRILDLAARVLLCVSALLVCALLGVIVGVVVWRGAPHLTWELVTSEESILRGTAGILPAIANTLTVILLSLSIAMPLGIAAAVYLTEYARSRTLVTLIEFAAETLAGIPSIIYALVGVIIFCTGLGLQKTLLAASLTLSIMILPTVIRTTQESLKTVPQSYREGALGLGAGKWHMIATVVLPSAVGGIITGCILSIGRVIGESAVLLYTAGLSTSMQSFTPADLPRASGATLSSALYIYAKERSDLNTAFAIALLLLLLSVLLNFSAALAGKRLKGRKEHHGR